MHPAGCLRDDPFDLGGPEPFCNGPEAVPVVGKGPVLHIRVNIKHCLADIISGASGDSLCVTRLDWLGRSLPELPGTVGDLSSRGIHVASLKERTDISSAAGELVFHVFRAIAQLERRLISGRTREGIAAARRRGSRPGRPPADPEKAAALRKLVEAARQLGIGRSTAYRFVRQGGDECSQQTMR